MPPPADLAAVVTQLELNADAQIDVGYLQGRDAVLRQLERRTGQNEEQMVDRHIEGMKAHVADIKSGLQPYHLPSDYLSFLEWYGGLSLYGPDEAYYFAVFGVGPMVEDWYSAVLGEDILLQQGTTAYLPIAGLSFRTGTRMDQAVRFFMCFAENTSAPTIIWVGPTDDAPSRILLRPNSEEVQSGMTQTLAATFTDWLALAGKTRGSFNY
jgi:hypothetical protein